MNSWRQQRVLTSWRKSLQNTPFRGNRWWQNPGGAPQTSSLGISTVNPGMSYEASKNPLLPIYHRICGLYPARKTKQQCARHTGRIVYVREHKLRTGSSSAINMMLKVPFSEQNHDCAVLKLRHLQGWRASGGPCGEPFCHVSGCFQRL